MCKTMVTMEARFGPVQRDLWLQCYSLTDNSLSEVLYTESVNMVVPKQDGKVRNCVDLTKLGLEGVVCMVDDVLVHARTQEEHDQRLDAALARIRNAQVTVDTEKCEFSQDRVKFLGHIVDGTGIQPDPEKVQAIQAMKKLTNTLEVCSFPGMTNQLVKFAPSLVEKAKPLWDILSNMNAWVWRESQQHAFQEIKQELSSAPILAIYDPNLDTVVSAGAFSFGLGAVLMQIQPDAS